MTFTQDFKIKFWSNHISGMYVSHSFETIVAINKNGM